ncbi:MAG TPA: hypothetical protein VGA81_14395 [Methylomirabilota bacterium]
MTVRESTVLRALLMAVSLALLLARDGDAQTELQCPELSFYLLVGFNYPCPIAPRVCRTDYGQCRIGIGIRPGTPCQCWASSNGLWYPGVCIR